jgi:hypothetical protein
VEDPLDEICLSFIILGGHGNTTGTQCHIGGVDRFMTKLTNTFRVRYVLNPDKYVAIVTNGRTGTALKLTASLFFDLLAAPPG